MEDCLLITLLPDHEKLSIYGNEKSKKNVVKEDNTSSPSPTRKKKDIISKADKKNTHLKVSVSKHTKRIHILGTTEIRQVNISCNVDSISFAQNLHIDLLSVVSMNIASLDLRNISVRYLALEKCFGTLGADMVKGNRIENLSVHSDCIVKCPFISELKHCKMIKLDRGKKDKNYVYLNDLPMLEEVWATIDNRSGDRVFSNVPNMKKLYICYSKMRDWSFLKEMTKLKTLYISHTSFSDTNLLSGLLNLKTLCVTNTMVDDLKPISHLCIETLYLCNIPARNFDEIQKMRSVGYLTLGGNDIESIEFLENMPNLYQVFLGNNRITCVEPLVTCKKLGWVFINNNFVFDPSPFSRCMKLHCLNMSDNLIFDASTIRDSNAKYKSIPKVNIARNFLSSVPTTKSMKFDHEEVYRYDQIHNLENERYTGVLTNHVNNIMENIEPEEFIHNVPAKLLALIKKDYLSPRTFSGQTFEDIFDRVWQLIYKHESSKIIIKILMKDLKFPCSENRFYTVATSICPFYDEFALCSDIIVDDVHKIVEDSLAQYPDMPYKERVESLRPLIEKAIKYN